MQIFGWRFDSDLSVASDGYFDWTADNGDRHYDVVTAKLLRRKNAPALALLVVGPIMLSCAAERVATAKETR